MTELGYCKVMPSEVYDVAIIGGGNAAFGVTVPTRAAGMKVVMVEARDLGGTCPNRGCTPKKVLVAAAHALHEIGQAHVHCISVGKPVLDWAGLIDREKEMIAGIPDSLAETLEERGVELIRDHAKFVGVNEVEAGGRRIKATHIVIATGAKPRPLPIPGAELMITSDEMLSERKLPASVVFVGGGVIALEFSHVYARSMPAPARRSRSSKSCRGSCPPSMKMPWQRCAKRASASASKCIPASR
jgi:glutathione reductase (NADPH)